MSSDDEVRALRWVRRNIDVADTVNTDPEARGRGEWALIPAFGERRMGIGFGLFEPNPERFRPQMARVAQAFRDRRRGPRLGYSSGSTDFTGVRRAARTRPLRRWGSQVRLRVRIDSGWCSLAGPWRFTGSCPDGRFPRWHDISAVLGGCGRSRSSYRSADVRPSRLGWIAGLAIGYTTSCIAFWAVLAAAPRRVRVFAAVWAVEGIALWVAARFWPWPVDDAAAWTRRDTAVFAAVVLVAPLLMAAPYRNLGAADAVGHALLPRLLHG